MDAYEEKNIIEETEAYFMHIKDRLKNKVNNYNMNERELSISDNVFTIPYEFDRNYLQDLCTSEGIRMWYTSTNDRPGMINYLPRHDIINFSQRTIDIIIQNNLLIRRIK